MKRREFITLLGGAAAAWPLAARAQQAKAADHRIFGRGHAFGLEPLDRRFCPAAARTRLDRRPHVAIEYRWAEGRSERFAEIAAEFVRLKVDVIVTVGTAVLAARQATSVIPIVFAVAVDPVGTGLVASLARPGGNVTGLSIQSTDLVGKRLELLRESSRSPPVGDHGQCRLSGRGAGDERGSGSGPQTWPRSRRRSKSVERRISRPPSTRSRARCKHFICVADALVNANRVRINTLALGARLPTMYRTASFVESGRSDVLWTKYHGPVPARRRLCRQDSARGEARRHAGRAADQVRSRHQPDDRQGARPDDPGCCSPAPTR